MSLSWKKILPQKIDPSLIHWDYSLQRFNTLRLDSIAECLIEPCCVQDLQVILPVLQEFQIPFFVLGRGSNLILAESYWQGVVLHLSGSFREKKNLEGLEAYTGSAVLNTTFVKRCSSWNKGGIEFLASIPGTIGGAVAMNAGAYGSETCLFLKQIDWVDWQGKYHESKAEDLSFSYRFSSVAGKGVIAGALFQLQHSSVRRVKSLLDKHSAFRQARQPLQMPSCGSVFKNPSVAPAGQLIESVGLKGVSNGQAQISEKHANFIVNHGQATASDILKLIEMSQEKVMKEHGVQLELEAKVLRQK